ncbi:hypothetical protein [Oscillatoria nigro-viridis]|uniref:hypothetical protein n=1 Tax=Phormidium nigroviride TaxID=482564 RepID=UPI00030BF3D4|nr:hypothetical protein [Oscillatoria nigro-viridis]
MADRTVRSTLPAIELLYAPSIGLSILGAIVVSSHFCVTSFRGYQHAPLPGVR